MCIMQLPVFVEGEKYLSEGEEGGEKEREEEREELVQFPIQRKF